MGEERPVGVAAQAAAVDQTWQVGSWKVFLQDESEPVRGVCALFVKPAQH